MSVTEFQEKEIKRLKALLDERRRTGQKGSYPTEVRVSLLRLCRAGVPIKILGDRLGVATSMLYAWAKAAQGVKAAESEAAQVVRVDATSCPPLSSGPAELRLQLGSFAVTIAHVEG